MRVPPGVSASDFAEAIKQFEEAVGKEWVFTSDADVALYRDAYSPFMGEPDEIFASAAVAPDGVEHVQKVVKIANRYKIPIYPVSTGKNLGYGGSAPVLSGSVVLDLKRMNRILEVNERNAYALVEPGVSYFDLYRYIQEKGLKLWVDVPDPGWGSPIGNSLDRGGGYLMPQYRNHFDSHCGMEVVLANGEVMRTGMGAMPGAQTWQEYKSGFGPWIDGMFSQSNFGVVTKMGFWLMPEPDAYLSGTVTVFRHDDLIPLVNILNYLENTRVTNGMPDLASPLLGIPMLSEFAARFDQGASPFDRPQDPELTALVAKAGGNMSPELDDYAQQKGVGYWSCKVSFYGATKANAANWAFAKEKFSAIAGAKFADGESYKLPLTAEQREKVHKPQFGIPSLAMFSIGARSALNPEPTNGHMWFSPIIPRTGEAIFEANRVFAQAAKDLGLPFLNFNLPSTYWERAFIFIFAFPVVKNIETNKKNRESFKKLIQVAAEHGWGEYRTAPAFQDAIMNTYSYNNHALLRFHETVKDAIDPNGILSAGRYGIWPKHVREAKS
ncbi:MAG TPA: FAD-binding oxidoreductase [Candidatus Acidoferrales bacterium]|jgi:FAD/FMN-containing dehydrogenase|nr:FAD-binding oxidoreductase [Candidatus Acidoferrales bacterium]